MTITATYVSRVYATARVVKRYVRSTARGYQWCETGAHGLDLRQGTCDGSDLPDTVRAAADAQTGQAFSYVEWPL